MAVDNVDTLVSVTVCATPGHGELTVQRGGSGGESQYTGQDFVADAQRIDPVALLGHRTVQRWISGVQPRHVVTPGVRVDKFDDDLVERQRAGVNNFRVGRAEVQQILGHDGAGVQTGFASLQ